jgi:pimeloyl-ACP methyl ester carboxylesterase
VNVVVNDLLANYELSGRGKPVLLLHGWGDSSAGLKDLQKNLSEKYQVLAPDLPGFGKTQAPKEAWDLDDYSNWTAELLKKLDLDQPYAVIGHSNGGALAVRAVSLGSLKPKKLILLAASGVRTNNAGRRFLFKVVAKAGNIATIWMPERYRRGLRKSLYGAAGSDILVVPELEDTFKKTVRQDVQGDAAAIGVPTLLVYAQNDDAVPVADGRQYNSLVKNSKLEIVEDAGHFVHLDQPDKVLNLIGDFLK